MRAVAVIVHRIAVRRDVVDAARVVGCEIRMRVVDAGIDHRHRDRVAGRNCPRFRRVDVGVRRTHVETEIRDLRDHAVEQLSGVVERPLLLEPMVAGDRLRPWNVSDWRAFADQAPGRCG